MCSLFSDMIASYPAGKIKRAARIAVPADPMPQSKITSSRLCGPPESPSYSSGGIDGGSGGDESGTLLTSIFGLIGGAGFSDTVAGICGASVRGGAAIAGSGSDAHAGPV